jgi:GxxExxY protein
MNSSNRTNDKLTEKIIGACYEVHNQLGPGFSEKIYHNALKITLNRHGLKFDCEKNFSVDFQGHRIGNFRADLIIEDHIIIEIKAVNGFMPKAFESQIIAYLKASHLKTGLLINFGNQSCLIRRIMNNDPFNHRDYRRSGVVDYHRQSP